MVKYGTGEVLCGDPKGRRALLRILSTEGRSVHLCWAKSKPEGPKDVFVSAQGLLEIKETHCPYRGTSLIRKRNPQGPYRKPVPRILGESKGGGRFLVGEVSL